MLHGHGKRERQQRGPAAPGEAPAVSGVFVRRYRCQRCGVVCWVAPRDVLPRYLYSGPAIAWALALYGLACMRVGRVRARVCVWRRPGATAHGAWTSLQRWVQDVGNSRLFTHLPQQARGATYRARAARLAGAIAAQAPPAYQGRTLHDRAFFAARAAWLTAA